MEELDRNEGESAGDYTARLRGLLSESFERASVRTGQIEALGVRLDAQDEAFAELKERERDLEREVQEARVSTASSSIDQRTHQWWQQIAREEKADNRQLRTENAQLHRQVITAQTNADSWERMYHESKDDKGDQSQLDKFLMMFVASKMADGKDPTG